jgi:hypothetical protein
MSPASGLVVTSIPRRRNPSAIAFGQFSSRWKRTVRGIGGLACLQSVSQRPTPEGCGLAAGTFPRREVSETIRRSITPADTGSVPCGAIDTPGGASQLGGLKPFDLVGAFGPSCFGSRPAFYSGPLPPTGHPPWPRLVPKGLIVSDSDVFVNEGAAPPTPEGCGFPPRRFL